MAADETKVGIGNLSVTITEKKRLDVSLCTVGTYYDTEEIAARGREGLLLSCRS